MCKEDKQFIKAIVLEHMLDIMDTDQARTVTDLIIDDVVKDVEECADGENWNDSDVRLAIGRSLVILRHQTFTNQIRDIIYDKH